MIERAPSGAYVEEWVRTAGSEAPLEHRVLADDRQLYRTGDIAVLVKDRAQPVPRPARLLTLVEEAASDRDAIEALIDCEFSLAERQDGLFSITASTLPWRCGEEIDVDIR